MYRLLIAILTLGSSTVYANTNINSDIRLKNDSFENSPMKTACAVAFEFVNKNGAYTDNLLQKKDAARIKKVMESKGYHFVNSSDGAEGYKLTVRAIKHLTCGYNAAHQSFLESTLLETNYSVKFIGRDGSPTYEKGGNMSKFFLLFPGLTTRKALLKAVQQIPHCVSAR